MTSPEEREELGALPSPDLEERVAETVARADDVVAETKGAVAKTGEALGEGGRAVAEAGKAATGKATDVVDEALDWVTAVGLGIRDTARDVLERGREGAREAYKEYWRRYDEKTVLRREQPVAPSRERKKGKKKRR